ncbi:MAG: gliding motility-associated C-terminal domain-containing protein [Bacteroidales bacterium]|nr:gliding motility-associated C-terminal domain-containing protein [Bacteroidales bacterium]
MKPAYWRLAITSTTNASGWVIGQSTSNGQGQNSLYIPNDGINNIFEIKNLLEGNGYTDNHLYIYNHWGRKVYYKKNISKREDFWDPSLNNDPDGTYYYHFTAKGYLGRVQRNGVI